MDNCLYCVPLQNKNQKTFNNPVQGKIFKVNQYMASRPFVRQGALAQRRSNYQGSRFPVAKDFAGKAAVAPLRNRPFNNNVMPYLNKARYSLHYLSILLVLRQRNL
ncbi:hypothetical protein LINPERPRIM_LOCUS14921 [Linum perenne]